MLSIDSITWKAFEEVYIRIMKIPKIINIYPNYLFEDDQQ